MKKKILKGLKRLVLFPVTANTADTYTVGEKVNIPGAQTLTLEPDTTDWKVFADDEVYEAGTDWNGMNMTLQLAELPLELKPHFEGGEYDETEKTYEYKSSSVAPEIGIGFAALTSDGEYRMKKIFALRCGRVTVEHRSKGSGDAVSPVSITGIVTSRLKDGVVTVEKDSADGALTWLDTLVASESEG